MNDQAHSTKIIRTALTGTVALVHSPRVAIYDQWALNLLRVLEKVIQIVHWRRERADTEQPTQEISCFGFQMLCCYHFAGVQEMQADPH
jgi:hypothetical protein